MIHLHTHSSFSVGDAVADPSDIAKRASGGTIALTDHNTLAGVVEHQIACDKHDVEPLFGVELDIYDDLEHRLTLLAMNTQGYHNLIQLVRNDSRTLDDVASHSDSVIALSGDLKGAIPQAILREDVAGLNERLRQLTTIFGDRFYLEKIDHGIPEQKKVIFFIDKLTQNRDIESVWTNDVHYLSHEDATVQAALMCDRINRSLTTSRLQDVRVNGAYLTDLEDPVARSIAQRCNLSIEVNPDMPYLPDFVAEGFEDSEKYLWHKTLKGLKRRFPNLSGNTQYHERLEYEYDIICEMGFAGYFLIVANFIEFAHKRDIPVGPGRGSGAGSLVAYCLGITDLDPLKYDLLFERFLNPERVSMPDFDIDFCIEKRDMVFEHVRRTYGTECCAGISTYGENKSRSAWKNTARLFGVNAARSNTISKKYLPDPVNNPGTIAEFKRKGALDDVLEKYPQYEDIFDIASRLEGTYRNVGKHAGGVIISDKPVETYAPVKPDEDGVFDQVVEFHMEDAEKIGLVKFDFLGLAELTVLDRVSNQVGVDLDSIPLDDQATFDLIGSGNTLGCFQIGSSGFAQMMAQMQPWLFEHIIAAVALYRPGPKDAGMIDDFIDRMHGRQEVTYIHEDLKDILEDTYGVILYQEQIMHIAQQLAGYTLGGADILRRGVGKKKRKVIDAQKPIFLEGVEEHTGDPSIGKTLWEQIETFAKYGFNKAHSTGYGLLAYQTAYFKAHYPAEFIASQMHVRRDDFDKLNDFIDNARAMGLEVIEPDATTSPAECFGEDGTIYLGLNTIKSMGDETAEEIESSQPFGSLNDFLEKADPNPGDVSNLVAAGAMDKFIGAQNLAMACIRRSELDSQADHLVKEVRKYTNNDQQGTLFSVTEAGVELRLGENEPWDPYKLLLLEKQVLGRYRSDHPARIARKNRDEPTSTLRLWQERHDDFSGSSFPIVVIIDDVRTIITKKDEEMAFLTVEDDTGRDSVAVFPGAWDEKRLEETDQPVLLMVTPNKHEGDMKLSFNSIEDL